MASSNGNQQILPLFLAAYLGDLSYLKGKFEGVKLREAFERVRDEKGRTALHFGAAGGATQVCKYLVEDLKVNIDVRDAQDTTPLHEAIWGDHYQTAVYLLENGAKPNAASKNGVTALHYAAKQGSKKLMQLLISKGAEINGMSQSGTPLQMAVAEGKKDAVKFLLDNHADPNAIHYRTFSPLLVAIVANSLDCVKLLLQGGADPNICSSRVSPLEMAVSSGSEIIKCLLAAGANPDYCNSCGLTPLEGAAVRGQHEEVLALFPVTTRIAGITDWSPAGVMKYVRSDEALWKQEKKKKKDFLVSKSKGDAAFRRKDYIEAIDFYSNCVNLYPFDATILSNRSLCWAKLKDGEQALSDALICISVRPEWFKGYYRQGVAWKLLENFGKATDSFLTAWQLDVKNEELESAYYESVNAQAEYNKTRRPRELEEQLQEAFGKTVKISE